MGHSEVLFITNLSILLRKVYLLVGGLVLEFFGYFSHQMFWKLYKNGKKVELRKIFACYSDVLLSSFWPLPKKSRKSFRTTNISLTTLWSWKLNSTEEHLLFGYIRVTLQSLGEKWSWYFSFSKWKNGRVI